MLSAALKSELTRLSMPDRLEALEFIRSTVVPPADGFCELTSGQKNELLRRARAAEAHPEQGRSWEEVKRRIVGG